MTYSNPLGIFSEDQLDKLSTNNLKSFKKEILLHFQLSDEATIERNGQRYDKNQVLEIFEDLQQNLDLHLNIQKNLPLRLFLTDRNLDFFKDSSAKNTVQQNYLYRDKIDLHIASQLNSLMADLVNNRTAETAETLQSILGYTSKMDSTIRDKAYNKSYLELKSQVDKLRLKHPHPFAGKTGLGIHPDLKEVVDPLFYDCFEHLPGAFQDIGYTYGVWCHNDIVNNAFKRESIYSLYDRDDLEVISRAMEIGCHVTKSEAFLANALEIKNYLADFVPGATPPTKQSRPTHKDPKTQKRTNRTSNKNTPNNQGTPRYKRATSDAGSFSGKSIIQVILFLFLFLRLCFGVAQCNKSNSSNYNKRVYSPQEIYQKEFERTVKRQERSARKAKTKSLVSYVGEGEKFWHKNLLKTEAVDNVIKLVYQVDVFPSNITDFDQLIPEKIKNKHPGESKDFVVKFVNADFIGHSFSYRFRCFINNQGSNNKITLDKKSSENGGKLEFTIKRLLKKKQLKGRITRYQSSADQLPSSTTFEISEDIVPAPAIETKGQKPPPTFAEEKFDRWDDYAISNLADQQYKNIILNNFLKISHKKLKQGNYYTIQSMATYDLSQNPEEPQAKNIREIKGNLRLDYVSSEDEVATVSMYGDNFYIRYFVSGETNRIIGMNMVTASGAGGAAELIEVFFE